ncbi:glycosyltransferase family 2 protein [Gelidibacter japonicus]|uniref:glycosyltransferase family 2 protein n=1 Tax=Gelidibacter japonicus TaxID=1962232 RepID=UPI0013D36406|nr:glycosyltransferase family A protein [Gelidibacter japonicus]
MIIVYHNNHKVDSVFDHQLQEKILVEEKHILKTLMHLASICNDRILVWCRLDCKELLNHKAVSKSFKVKNIMISYGNGCYLPDAIGYVENSPFVNVKTSVKYPTWLMHSTVGAIYTTSLLKFKDLKFSNDFEYDLNSIAKQGMPKGLFCYSEPNLFLKQNKFSEKPAGLFTLFRFVKQHYRTRWVFLLCLNFLWHERKLTLLPLLNSLFYRKRMFEDIIPLETLTTGSINSLPSIDVIIPTIGRANYLHDVLKDLAEQTHLPNKVIIVEQNPDVESSSALGFIYSEAWPFQIKHQFIHQTGACNARNLGLKEVDSEFLFLADDDIRFEPHVLKDALTTISNYDLEAVTLSCLREGEEELHQTSLQWFTFGSGCSIVAAKRAKKITFDTAFEFGFGEDSDYGMQLRSLGWDIVYLSHVQLHHLKAPIGGFRTVHSTAWTYNSIHPKPSPTVMLNYLKHKSPQQMNGYKTLLYLKFYKKQGVQNPIVYIRTMNVQWKLSLFWAEQLMYKTE